MEGVTVCESTDFELLSKMAYESWHSAYDALLGAKQVDYMLDKFQSAAAMREQTQKQNYTYYLIAQGKEKIGYCALQGQGRDLFLSKVYLSEGERGKGIGQKVLTFVVEEAARRSAERVYLTVNKNNVRAIRAYEKFGFLREGEECTAIGEGYYMDDYIYAIRLGKRCEKLSI